MAKDNNQSLPALEINEVQRVVLNLHHLVNKLFTRLLHQPITCRSILCVKQICAPVYQLILYSQHIWVTDNRN